MKEGMYQRTYVEHLLMQMFWHKDDADYIETSRPNMIPRNHDGTNFKIKNTKNHRVHEMVIPRADRPIPPTRGIKRLTSGTLTKYLVGAIDLISLPTNIDNLSIVL